MLDDTRLPKQLQPKHILGPSYPSIGGDVFQDEDNGEDGNNVDSDFDPQDFSMIDDSMALNTEGLEQQDLSESLHLYLEDSSDEDDEVFDTLANGFVATMDIPGSEETTAATAEIPPPPQPMTTVHVSSEEIDRLCLNEPSTSSNQAKRQRTHGSYQPQNNVGSNHGQLEPRRLRSGLGSSSSQPQCSFDSKFDKVENKKVVQKASFFQLHCQDLSMRISTVGRLYVGFQVLSQRFFF